MPLVFLVNWWQQRRPSSSHAQCTIKFKWLQWMNVWETTMYVGQRQRITKSKFPYVARHSNNIKKRMAL